MSWHCGGEHCPTHSSPEHACQNWKLAPISGPVGKGAANAKNDVRIVQGGLNRAIGRAATLPRLATNGACTDVVIAAIAHFQREALGAKKPDARVDAGGKTYQAVAAQLHLKRIVVSLSDQRLEAMEDGRTVYWLPCVTGNDDHRTKPGSYTVLRKKHPYHSHTYDVDMNYAMFFTNDGAAIHQYHGAIGLSADRFLRQNVSDWIGSHGCVRLDEENARALYNWTPVSTQIYVY